MRMPLAALPRKAPAGPRIGLRGETGQGRQTGALQCAEARRERVPYHPRSVVTAALLAAYFLGLDFVAAAVFAGLGFLVRAGVRPVGLCGRGGVPSIRRRTSSSRF